MEGLPPALRSLVRDTMTVLGEEYAKVAGKGAHQRLLKVRTRMARLRGASTERQFKELSRLLSTLRALPRAERRQLAHGLSLMMEVTNVCENAYRTRRLRETRHEAPSRPDAMLIWVLTAHPTESRTPQSLQVLHRLQHALSATLGRGREDAWERVRSELRSLCEIPLAPSRKPLPEDEARSMFTIALREDNLDAMVRLSGGPSQFYLRTWVGGDKDGHPGVGPRELRASLTISRRLILTYLDRVLGEIRPVFELHAPGKLKTLERWRKEVRALRVLRDGDHSRVRRCQQGLMRLAEECGIPQEILAPWLERPRRLTRMFPAWVLPLELREGSDEIHRALDVLSKGRDTAITGMLRALGRLADPPFVRHYARALIVSMTHEAGDLLAAQKLAHSVFGEHVLPVVPLFETVHALEHAPEILRGFVGRSRGVRRKLARCGVDHVEVMLGYSDSSKECGVLYSRLSIHAAMAKLERVIRHDGFRPLFFHGSGGSVARGGGNLSEVTTGWSREALAAFKSTLQGEVVSRTFSSPEILSGQILKVRQLQAAKRPPAVSVPPAFKRWADGARVAYEALVGDPDFLRLVQQATLYPHLHQLRIGSRPSKRKGLKSVQDLRAIPWQLCWTQARLLFPTWWGLGSSWQGLTAREKAALKTAFRRGHPLLTSFIKQVGFTLAKVEMGVWRLQLSRLGEATAADWEPWEREYQSTLAAFRAITGRKDLVWFRPWLGESIHLRSALIHPLNLLQILAIEENDGPLMRQTVTGIASGMLTTG